MSLNSIFKGDFELEELGGSVYMICENKKFWEISAIRKYF